MPLLQLNKRWPDGSVSSEELSAEVGQSVMQVAVAAGINEIAADCGGTLSCATCHVYVTPEWQDRLPPPGEDELAMLPFTAAERRDNSRLSCQIIMSDGLDGLVLELPERQY
jgi:2Fe-2S ferredoxin